MALKLMDIVWETTRKIPLGDKMTLIQSNTTQVYFDSNCALTCVLRVSACTYAILRYVDTKLIT